VTLSLVAGLSEETPNKKAPEGAFLLGDWLKSESNHVIVDRNLVEVH
jgi:hypothetical protein